jgi:hypothetical protein
MILIGSFESNAIVDALIFGIGAWFVVTKQSRVAACVVMLGYSGELLAGVAGDPKGAQVDVVTLLMLAAMIQAFRATLKWRKLVRIPQVILATEDMSPHIPTPSALVSSSTQGVV